MCDGVVTDVAAQRELEAENEQLNKDILHLKVGSIDSPLKSIGQHLDLLFSEGNCLILNLFHV